MTLLDLKHLAEKSHGLRKGTLARATRETEYVRARDFFVKMAHRRGFSLNEIDRFMGWSHKSAAYYLRR